MTTRSASRWILVVDLLWAVSAFFIAESLRYGGFAGFSDTRPPVTLLPFLAATVFCWVVFSHWMKLDCFRGGWRLPAMVSQVLLGVFCLMGVLFSGAYLIRQYVSRLALGCFGLLLFFGFVVIRYIARLMLGERYRTGNVRRLVIVGIDRIAHEVASKIRRHPEMMCEVVGFLYPEHETSIPPTGSGGQLTVSTLRAVDLFIAGEVTDLLLCGGSSFLADLLKLTEVCRGRGINVSVVPQPYELYISKPHLTDLDGIPLLELRPALTSESYLFCKRIGDIIGASILSIFALPLILPVAMSLRMLKGKAFRWETRCGQHAKPFQMIRLNVKRSSPQLGRLEKFLENISLTELPQLWNVLRGEMSLVGPRPESFDRVKHYSEWELRRLSRRPGMTGLAQVHGLRDQNSSEEKTRYDLEYISNPSTIADVSILLQTIWTLWTRLFDFSFAKSSSSTQLSPISLGAITSASLEEGLQHAHRAQSSAD